MNAPAATQIHAPELRRRLQSPAPVRILDVRTAGEYETAHIAGSLNLPLNVLEEHRDAVVERLDGEVVLVCQSGQRAARADGLLREGGAGGGVVLHGGLADWEGRGFAVDRGEPRWQLERQVRLVAGSIVLTSVLGSVAVPKLKWVAALIGGGLTYAAVSDTCAMASGLARLPYNRGPEVDAQTLVSRLSWA